MSIKGIYRFKQDCGRSGCLEGIFTAESSEIEKAKGRDVYFSDMLGKHSEIEVTLSDACITLITQEPITVGLFITYEMATGVNPLDFVDWDSEEERA